MAAPDMQAVMQLFSACRERLSLTAFEFFTGRALQHVLAHGGKPPYESDAPCHVLVEYEAPREADTEAALAVFEQAAGEGWAIDGVMAQSQAQAADLWHLREGITESIAPRTPYKNDVSVRVSRVVPFMTDMQELFASEYPDVEVVWYGHIGDGNLHISVLRPEAMEMDDFVRECGRVTQMLCEVLKRHGGSISAEHGVGLLKKPYLASARSSNEIALMRQVKRIFDPHGILNPGKLFDSD